ncbi:hypothetical protein F8271_31310 [Micromonospora sp. ALFpr18c]|nr:hypothetical protein F8271_31310 [Micromonospora sp. ALFpr18c]
MVVGDDGGGAGDEAVRGGGVVADLTARLEQVLGRVAELEARLKQSSSNSSKPPSSDGLAKSREPVRISV